MYFSDKNQDPSGNGPAAIDGFEPVLQRKVLRREGHDWLAVDP